MSVKPAPPIKIAPRTSPHREALLNGAIVAMLVLAMGVAWWYADGVYHAQLLEARMRSVEDVLAPLAGSLAGSVHAHSESARARHALRLGVQPEVIQGGVPRLDGEASALLLPFYAPKDGPGGILVSVPLSDVLAQTGFVPRGLPGLRLALVDAEGRLFAGDVTVMHQHPAIVPVQLDGTYWTLAAVPTQGWEAAVAAPLLRYRLVSGAISLALFGALMLGMARDRAFKRAVRRGQDDLALSQTQYAQLFDVVPDVMLVSDAEGLVLAANRAAQRFFGAAASARCARLDTLLRAAQVREPEPMAARLLSMAPEDVLDLAAISERGGELAIEARAVGLSGRAETGRRLLVLRNVTAQRQYQAALSRSEAFYKSLIENSPVATSVLDEDGRFLLVNQRLAELAGYASPAELLAARPEVLLTVPPEERPLLAEQMQRAVEAGESGMFQAHVQRPDGSIVLVETGGAALRDAAGRVHYLTLLRDITTEQKARDLEHEYQAKSARMVERVLGMLDLPAEADAYAYIAEAICDLSDCAASAIGTYDAGAEMLALRAIAGNPALASTLVETIGLIKGQASLPVSGSMLPLLLGRRLMLVDGLFEMGMGILSRERARAIENQFDLGAACLVGLGRQGGLVGAIGILMPNERSLRFPSLVEAFASHATSLLMRREAELALARSEERFRSLFENAGDALVLLDHHLTMIEFHDTSSRALGLEPEQVVGQPYAGVFGPWREAGLDIAGVAADLLAGGLPLRRAALPWPNPAGATSLDVVAYGVPMGGEMCIALVGRDVTQLNALRQTVLRKERAEELGNFAQRVAHDFRHVLQVMLTTAEQLVRGVGTHNPNSALAQSLVSQVLRGSELTNKLVAFSKGDQIKIELYPLAPLLMGQEQALRQVAGEGVSLRFDIEPGPIFLRCDESHVRRILTNLVNNAHDALPRGGHILIRARLRHLHQEASRTFDLAPGYYAEIEVSDDGEGIAPENLPRIFEPFFTTKGSGGIGSGLGLAMAHVVMRQQDGHITVESELGQGTTFRLYLPVLNPEQLADTMSQE